MKNSSKFLFLVLAVPLLTGCGKVKEPKFADFGAEKTYEEFVEAFRNCIGEDHELMKEDILGSLVIKSKSASSETDKQIRGKATIADSKTTESSSSATDYDAVNGLAKSKGKSQSKTVEKDKYGKVTKKESSSADSSVQEYTKGDSKYVISVNNNIKEYTPVETLVDDATIKDYLSENLKYVLITRIYYAISSAIVGYPGASEEEQKNYKFYVNGNIYSVVYESKVENKEVKNETDDSVKWVYSETNVNKLQVDVTAGAYRILSYSKQEGKTEFKIDYEGYAKGDVREYSKLASEELTADRKEPGLKAVDLAKYSPVGFPNE